MRTYFFKHIPRKESRPKQPQGKEARLQNTPIGESNLFLLIMFIFWLVACVALVIPPSYGATAPTHTETYAYDALGRVTQSSSNFGGTSANVEQYTFDPAGNRLTKVLPGSNSHQFTITPAGGSITLYEDSTAGPQSYLFTVSRSVGGTSEAVSISTDSPADIFISNATLSFGPTELSKTMYITAINDTIHEGTETHTVTFSGGIASTVVISGSPRTIIIIDND